MLFRSPLRWIVHTLPRGTAAAVLAVAVVGLAPVAASAAGTPPSNTSPPTISGYPVEGHPLLANPGIWSGSPPIKFAYQWLRCDQGGGNCAAIAAAKAQSYRSAAADIGHTLRVTVTASNAYGTATATSLATAVITTAAPVNTAPPTISGNAQQGQTLTAAPGSWSGARPLTFIFNWHRCDPAGSACVHIAGGRGPTYLVSSADVGHTLRVGVAASNRFGTGVARSAPTSVVVAVRATLGLSSRSRSVVYGRSAQLSGSIAPRQAGIRVMIEARRFGVAGLRRVATVSTGSDGFFSAIVKPRIRTVYLAKLADGTTSGPVAVSVRPHLQLATAGKQLATTGTHLFSLTVYAARSFVGKVAQVQRWSPLRHTWLTMGSIHMRTAHPGPTTRTNKLFILRVGHGLKLRVRLPLNQATTGYLTGLSNTIRT